MHIRALTHFPDAAWNAYVDAHPAGRLFHLSEWGAVYADLPWITPAYLVAEAGARIVGVLPLAQVRWGLGGCAMVSAPYCVESGALADDAAVRSALESAALERARAVRARFLELRQSAGRNPAWPCDTRYAGFARALAADEAANLAAVPRKQRAMIRKGEQAGLASIASLDAGAFYRLYACSMRNLGTPLYPRRLFERLLAVFGARAAILEVHAAGEPVTAVLSFYYKDCVMPYYAGGLPRARALRAYDLMYWRLMQDAVRRGCRTFDFGRSVQGSGAYAFKKNWGFEPRPLCYQLVAAGTAPVAPLEPDSRRNRLARRAWSHLPLALANRLGPWFARRLY